MPIAPAPERFGPIWPPCPLIMWQDWQSATSVLPLAGSPAFADSAVKRAVFWAMAANCSALSKGGASVVRTILAPLPSLPQAASPLAEAKTSDSGSFSPAKVRVMLRRISAGLRSTFQIRYSARAPSVPPFGADQPMVRPGRSWVTATLEVPVSSPS